MPEAAARFALFVSSVEGKPVTRWGTRTLIGGTRSPATPDRISYDTEHVVAIPHDEYSKFRREYDRALDNGSLRRRAVADWQAQNRQPEQNERREGTPSAPEVTTSKKKPQPPAQE